jgi:hypothetical protein
LRFLPFINLRQAFLLQAPFYRNKGLACFSPASCGPLSKFDPTTSELTMNRTSILFAALATVGLISAAGFAQAADAPASAPATSANTTPTTPQEWAGKMLDTTQNAAAFRDPAAFQQWTNAMLNPATSMAMMQQGMDPNTTIRLLSGLMNPASMQNYMQFTDPNVAMKWLSAGIDPRFATAMLSQGLNPNVYSNMMAAPFSPQMMGMGTQMLNPNMYTNWMTAPMNPAAVNTMMAPLNPNLYTNWMNTGMNPNTYGSWGQMMTMPMAQTGAQTGGIALDPAMLLKLLQLMPTMAQPGR